MIKDSGERREFESGAVRDIQEGKGRCDLLPVLEIAKFLNDSLWENSDPPQHSTLDFVGAALESAKDGKLLSMQNFISSAIYTFMNFTKQNPYKGIIEVSKHFEEGALKYGDRNWEKGIPFHCYFDSGIRHYLKYMAGETDERHDRAFLWNMFCLKWTSTHHPELNDLYEGEENVDKK